MLVLLALLALLVLLALLLFGGDTIRWFVIALLIGVISGTYSSIFLASPSLVLVEEREGETRYQMLETIREYAAEELDTTGETGSAIHSHARYFLELG